MIHRLQFKLLVSFVAVIAIAMGMVFIFVSHNAQSEFQQFGMQYDEARFGKVEFELKHYYLEHGDWEGIQSLVEQWGNLYDRRIILTDYAHLVVADSENILQGQLYTSYGGRALSVNTLTGGYDQNSGSPSAGDTLIGTLYIDSATPAGAEFPTPVSLTPSIERFLLLGGGLALAIALLISWFLSRRILSPVQSIIQATEGLSRGDLSQRVMIADKGELGAMATAFNSMAGELEHSREVQHNMIADIAHELRTPLSNINGYLEAVQDGVVRPDQVTINTLTEETRLLSRLVNDLQELSLAEIGELRLQKTRSDVKEVIHLSIRAIQRHARAKGIKLKAVFGQSLPAVEMDTHRIGQVLNNLLENAVTHSENGDAITVKAEYLSGFVEISIEDTGEGIPETELKYVFDRFYRVDKSRSRHTGGSGLGLSIVKGLVEAHGGTIRVSSTVGKGTIFTFKIPA
ncbi:hypothetical protein ASJ33_07845 [Dehalococcoides mccartyi]|uniref:sensor histidine kinase n=1 Tax=Dehalococcoides mccartyi TaxID=61435 RepID=UPI00090C07BF|nr:ATP-binding protein [Dehalococcoides mccartyi]APH13072.1 hypothetical protein ASJ33_07845 [Dehalococcoides mccartyi]